MKHACSLFAVTVLAFVFAQMQMATAADLYVATNATGDGSGSSWANATNSIQGAINAIDGTYRTNTVWVSNGVYQTGGVKNYPANTFLTNRVAIWKAITVRSANNDPTNTIIKGAWDTNGVTYGVGPAAARCVWMTNGSTLIGFTLTNGATTTNLTFDGNAGGVLSQSTNTLISNCVIAGNSGYQNGGGAYYGTLYNCMVSGNKMSTYTARSGGGAYLSTMYNCILTGNLCKWGGGASFCTLYNCRLIKNSAVTGYGGATYYGTSYNCMMVSNTSTSGYGATYFGTLYNCTVVQNSVSSVGSFAGGVGDCTIINCIVYSNTAVTGNGPNWYGTMRVTNSCTLAGTGQVNFVTNGNITNYPMFNTNAGNFRLRAGSPCFDTGTNFSWMTDGSAGSQDLDGQRRISPVNGTVDMGAYELYFNRGTILGFR